MLTSYTNMPCAELVRHELVNGLDASRDPDESSIAILSLFTGVIILSQGLEL